MPAPRRKRQRRPGRRPPFRDPKPIILIVCEGQNTEPQYFEGFRRACHNPRVHIEVAPEHGVPKTLVQIAKQRKTAAKRDAKKQGDENLAYDSVWCVFDIDDHPNVSDAIQMARDNGIKLAVSNPCFELWLLLHFRDNPGMQHRDDIAKRLRHYVPEYDKRIVYATYAAGYAEAVTRAEQMDRAAAQDGEIRRNPSTEVYRITEAIRSD